MADLEKIVEELSQLSVVGKPLNWSNILEEEMGRFRRRTGCSCCCWSGCCCTRRRRRRENRVQCGAQIHRSQEDRRHQSHSSAD